jgi:hypothetical protein
LAGSQESQELTSDRAKPARRRIALVTRWPYPAHTPIRREHDGAVALIDRDLRETGAVTSPSVFAGFRFPSEVISVAVRWYLRYGLS